MTRQKMTKDMRKEQFKATKELFYSSVIGWIKCFYDEVLCCNLFKIVSTIISHSPQLLGFSGM